MSRNIFKHQCGEHSDFSLCVEDRLCDVKNCNEIDDLKAALDTIGLQVSVMKAIIARIRKLQKEQVRK